MIAAPTACASGDDAQVPASSDSATHAEDSAAAPASAPPVVSAKIDEVLVVELSADGDLRVDGAKIPERDLLAHARAAREKRPALIVRMRAANEVSHATVVRITGILRQAGLDQVRF